MSEEKKMTRAEAKEALENAKDAVQAAKKALRTFQQTNKVRKADELKDPKLKADYASLEKALEDAQTEKEIAQEAVAGTKGESTKGGGERYGYPEITDVATGQARPLTKVEKKHWRAHARKVAKKADPVINPWEVPFDPAFFAPKVKKEKPVKEPKAEKPAKEETPAEKPAKPSREERRAARGK